MGGLFGRDDSGLARYFPVLLSHGDRSLWIGLWVAAQSANGGLGLLEKKLSVTVVASQSVRPIIHLLIDIEMAAHSVV